MSSDTPVSTLIEGLFIVGFFVFAACMGVWYFKECQKIDREFEPIDRALAEIKARNDEWFSNRTG